MPIVSISEAARLANKSRKTIYKHIQLGKLSIVTTSDGTKGIDISELIRVYNNLNIQQKTAPINDYSKQDYSKGNTRKETHVTLNNQSLIELEKKLSLSTLKIEQQEKALSYQQQIIDAKEIALLSKQETIETLKSALKLLEYKQEKNDTGNIDITSTNKSKLTLNKNTTKIHNNQSFFKKLKKLIQYY